MPTLGIFSQGNGARYLLVGTASSAARHQNPNALHWQVVNYYRFSKLGSFLKLILDYATPVYHRPHRPHRPSSQTGGNPSTNYTLSLLTELSSIFRWSFVASVNLVISLNWRERGNFVGERSRAWKFFTGVTTIVLVFNRTRTVGKSRRTCLPVKRFAIRRLIFIDLGTRSNFPLLNSLRGCRCSFFSLDILPIRCISGHM